MPRISLRSLVRWGGVIAILVVLGGLGGYALSRRSHPYSATASLEFESNSLENSLLGNTAPQVNETTQVAATNVLSVNRAPVIAAAARELGLRESVAALQSQVSVAAEGGSNIADVTARSSSPREAVALANAVARQYVALQTSQMHRSIAAAQRGLAAELSRLGRLPRTNTISEREQGITSQQAILTALGSVKNANAQVIQFASAAGRTGRSRTTLIGIGVIVGLIIGLLCMWISHESRARRRLIAEERRLDLGGQTYLGLSRRAQRTASTSPLRESDAEKVRHLAVVFGLDEHGRGDPRTLVCASIGRSEPRFDLAWRLSQEASGLGANVLYVATGHSNGFSTPASEADRSAAPVPGASNLSALSLNGHAGRLSAQQLKNLIDDGGHSFDAIIVAAPPVVDDPAALQLAKDADAVILVASSGSAAHPAVDGNLAVLERVKAPRPNFVSLGAQPD